MTTLIQLIDRFDSDVSGTNESKKNGLYQICVQPFLKIPLIIITI